MLLLFVDGVGLAPAGPDNPFADAPTPALESVVGRPFTIEACGRGEGWLLAGLDAALGVPGLPPSASGQTALFTGVNGPAAVGAHVVGFPGPILRAIIEQHSLFRRLVAAGHSATFANAYSRGYFQRLEAGEVRPSVTTCAVAAAGLGFRDLDDLAAGRAVTWDIVGDQFARRHGGERLPAVDPIEAGRRLAALAAEHDFTLFETFLTDLAGHRRWGLLAEEAVRRVDGLLAGVLAAVPEGLTVVLTSDHGNVESRGSRSHTGNPVPLLAIGPGAEGFAGASSLLDVTPRILDLVARPI